MKPALGQVGARPLGLVRLEQHLAIPRDGRLQRLAQAALVPVLAGRALAELDARLLGQASQRLAEVEPVAPHAGT